MHYVFDTNALIHALLFASSKPGQAFRHVLRHGRVVVSSSALLELAEVLQRAKFERYVNATEREEFLAAFVERAVLTEPTETIRACRDASDDKFLELAVCGNASYIITGDEDLLALHPFRGIAILTPQEFLRVVEEQTTDE